MAGRTLGLAIEHRKAALGVFGDRLLVSLDPGIEWRALRHDRSFVSRDRLGERANLHALIWEGGLELRLVFGDVDGAIHQLVDRHVHFAGRLNRAERLLFERGEPAIPHEDRTPGRIDDGRRMPAELAHAVADAKRQAVAPAKARAVTARAGLRRAHRQ